MAPYWYAGHHEPKRGIVPDRTDRTARKAFPPSQVIWWTRCLPSPPSSTHRMWVSTRARLGSIGRHFDRYVEDRKDTGVPAVVTRRGKVAYVVRGGFRDLENGAPVEADTRFRIYSDDQADPRRSRR